MAVKVYSPYQLNDYQACPMRWWLKKRWKLRDANESKNMLQAAFLGNSIAEGLKEFYLSELDNQDERFHRAAMAGESYVTQHWHDGLGFTKNQAYLKTESGILTGSRTLLPLKTILAVEQPLGGSVWGMRPDLVGQDFEGNLAVVDHKVKLNYNENYSVKDLRRWDNSNQFLQYAWQVQQEYGQPVPYVYVHIIYLAPLPQSEIHRISTSQERINYWLAGATADWTAMGAIEAKQSKPLPRYSSCETDFGPCQFTDACHTFHGVEDRFPALYERTH